MRARSLRRVRRGCGCATAVRRLLVCSRTHSRSGRTRGGRAGKAACGGAGACRSWFPALRPAGLAGMTVRGLTVGAASSVSFSALCRESWLVASRERSRVPARSQARFPGRAFGLPENDGGGGVALVVAAPRANPDGVIPGLVPGIPVVGFWGTRERSRVEPTEILGMRFAYPRMTAVGVAAGSS
jgi:hypothetical protein